MEITAVIVTALILNMAGALLGKYLGMFTSQYFVFGALFMVLLAVYGLRVVFWLMVGKRWQISFIYPVLSLNYIFSFFLGLALFHETFEVQRLIASFVIIIGVLLVSRSPHRREESATC